MAKRAENPPLTEHPKRPGIPDIEGHRQRQDGSKRRVSEAVLRELEKRTKTLRKEILGE